MKVLILGAKGNMGKRYSRIVELLAYEPVEADIGDKVEFPDDLNHVIIATPTKTHASIIAEVLYHANRPMNILCEKPICTNLDLLEAMYDGAEKQKSNIYCVNQYAHLPEAELFEGGSKYDESVYDYFKHGPDGLHWDCFQIYALASGPVTVKESSLIWKCKINGVHIDLRNMDRAYIYMIEDFLGNKAKVWGRDVVVRATKEILKRI